MKKTLFISSHQAFVTLRVVASLIMISHGCMRIYNGTVGGFGEFLNTKGFLIGPVIAWGITIFELVGGGLLALGKFQRWVAAGFIVQHIMGIILVHATNGWFVVGASTGGAEYSVLLLAVFLFIAANDKSGTKQ